MEKQIVEKIIYFLSDIGGFDHWWDSIDEETQEEIKEGLEEIVKNK